MNTPKVQPAAEALVLMGRAFRPHGVKGELKVYPETDDPTHFEALETVYLGASPEQGVPYRVESVRYQQTRKGRIVLLKLEGVETPEAAEMLRGQWVFAEEAELPPLEEGEFFLHDLVGMDVVTEASEPVGQVQEVLRLPAHDTLVVAREAAEPALIPLVEALVPELDWEARRIVVRPIEGLLD